MDTKDKTPPASAVEPDMSAEEKAMQAEAERLDKRQDAAPDSTLPKVQSEQSTV